MNKFMMVAVAVAAILVPDAALAAKAPVAVDATIVDFKFGMVTLVGANGPQVLLTDGCKANFKGGDKVVVIHSKGDKFLVSKTNFTVAKSQVDTTADALAMLEPVCKLLKDESK